jgi:hypothetical protein
MFACAAPLLIGAAAIANASGFDDTMFRRWVEMRVGSGDPVYWYCIGTVFSYPEGKALMRVEGIDTARLDRSRSTPQIAHQLSRKTFVYRDLGTNEIVRSWRGQQLDAIEYPYQYITYELKGDSMETFVEQGSAARLQRIGPGTDIIARKLGNAVAFSAPLFLDLPLPDGARYQAFENYDFLAQPQGRGIQHPYQISWVRYGDLPAGLGKTVMHMIAWRVDRYADLPGSIRVYLESEAKLWRLPPKDMNEIRVMQTSALPR